MVRKNLFKILENIAYGYDKSYAKGKKVRMTKNVEQIALKTLFG